MSYPSQSTQQNFTISSNKIFSSPEFGGPNNSEIPAKPERAVDGYLQQKNYSEIRLDVEGVGMTSARFSVERTAGVSGLQF
jgi:hypothetical protein